MKFGENLPRSSYEIFEISKFQKSELGKFIPNFPLKHVITSTNKHVIYKQGGSHSFSEVHEQIIFCFNVLQFSLTP